MKKVLKNETSNGFSTKGLFQIVSTQKYGLKREVFSKMVFLFTKRLSALNIWSLCIVQSSECAMDRMCLSETKERHASSLRLLTCDETKLSFCLLVRQQSLHIRPWKTSSQHNIARRNIKESKYYVWTKYFDWKRTLL